MIGLSDLLWGGAFPLGMAAAALAIVWQLTGRAASAWRIAVVVGYVAGHWALDARNIGFAATLAKNYQPTEARDWLPLLLLLATLPDAIACIGKGGAALGWLLRLSLCAFVPWRFLRGSRYMPLLLPNDFGFETGAWSHGQAAAWIGGIAATLLLAWLGLRCVNPDREQGHEIVARSALAAIVAAGGAIVVAYSSSLIYGQLLGVLAATLAGAGISSALLQTKRAPEATAGPVVIVFGSLLILAYFYAELKLHNAAILLVAMTLAVGWLPLPAQLLPRWRITWRSVLCLAAITFAITSSRLDFVAAQAETESNPYQNLQP